MKSAVDERVAAGERAAPDRRREPRTDHGHRQRDGVADRKPHAGQEVVGQRVAGVALEDREGEHRRPDPGVQVARLAEGARQEDAKQVHDDRGDEDVRCPVMRLPDQQPGLPPVREVDRRAVRLRHRRSAQRRVRPVVDDVRVARLEEERQVDARRDEDEEAVERDLAEQERPVVGEDIVERLLDETRRADARFEEPDAALDHARTFHQDGPMRPEKSPPATR